ncbi:sensor histidine kinase [Mucilaginibacter sp. SP1R1]|uniref:sensor histidine kinase n=1 Tax=Mucilaginibacter sp. SP1R1 TaxID=2723091 RepID=UPI00161A3D20|nr:HAMP domain-containing sensor histidine kinase [Mucilaginibacter sp. SP1R1]MBB6150294.1 hypothetical protein [Mucilaginibacter sp. SP1R1]
MPISGKATTAMPVGLGAQISDFFSKLLNTADWPPRWHCGTWTDFHGWLYILSDVTIWASYFAIPVFLIRMLTKRTDIPFPKMIWIFIAFIVLCGTTHLVDAIIFWWPAYRLSALIRFFTAVVSAVAVYALYRVMPLILSLRTINELEREIKERKQAEEKLSQSHQQLKAFTHILSHNIRNHSSNISLLTSLVEPEQLDESNAELFDKITKVSRNLNHTLDDLAQAIRIRETYIAPESLSFDDVLNKVLEVLEPEIQGTDAKVNLNFKADSVLFPRLYMESILLNLLSNAIKYRNEDKIPDISLSTFKDDAGHVVLECSDNGLGIDLNLHSKKIFGLYKTFHVHKEAHGVGLFLIKTQVESQGGTISVESIEGEGTTFRIVFA